MHALACMPWHMPWPQQQRTCLQQQTSSIQHHAVAIPQCGSRAPETGAHRCTAPDTWSHEHTQPHTGRVRQTNTWHACLPGIRHLAPPWPSCRSYPAIQFRGLPSTKHTPRCRPHIHARLLLPPLALPCCYRRPRHHPTPLPLPSHCSARPIPLTAPSPGP